MSEPSFRYLLFELPAAATEFFATFSRFECALKRSGYVKADKHKNASPDWKKFAEDADPAVFLELRNAGTIACLIANPPKRQIVVNNRLEWGQASAVADTASLVDAVKRLRNNLFHGGKYPGEPERNLVRNETLLNEGLIVLRRLVEAHSRIRSAFFDALE